MTIVSRQFGPFAVGSTPVFAGQLVDADGRGIAANALGSLVLTIVDIARGAIVNGADRVNILNTGRGQVDASGNLTISLETGDTSDLPDHLPQAARALVIEWTYNGGSEIGRHQVNFELLALAA